VSAGGTGTYDVNTWAGEIQAGSYCLMDTTYSHAGAPFAQALTLLATVISANPAGWFVADLGLKALGMDHGNPWIEGASVWYCADEHTVFSADGGQFAVGQRVRVAPAHVDPTVALHERMHLVQGGDVLETWDVDLRGW
jgi:D-serine deaminase-like pyridoxal phosphate-dependent protein